MRKLTALSLHLLHQDVSIIFLFDRFSQRLNNRLCLPPERSSKDTIVKTAEEGVMEVYGRLRTTRENQFAHTYCFPAQKIASNFPCAKVFISKYKSSVITFVDWINEVTPLNQALPECFTMIRVQLHHMLDHVTLDDEAWCRQHALYRWGNKMFNI